MTDRAKQTLLEVVLEPVVFFAYLLIGCVFVWCVAWGWLGLMTALGIENY